MTNPEAQGQLNLLDYWKIIFQAKWLIIGLVLVSVLVTGIWCKLFLPELYKAKATLHPVREALSGLGGGIVFGGEKNTGAASRTRIW